MLYTIIYTNLLEQLRLRYPDEQELTTRLRKILRKDYRSVWRRLRGDSHFTIEEVSEICNKMDIEPHKILRTDDSNVFKMDLCYYPYHDLDEKDYRQMEKILDHYQYAVSSDDNHLVVACNIIPDFVFLKYVWITRFYRLKWQYFEKKPGEKTPALEEFGFTDRYISIIKPYLVASRSFKKTYILWDPDTVRRFIEDVIFFADLRLLSNVDLRNIVDDLRHMLKTVEGVADKGYINNPENELVLCISSAHLHNTYTLIHSTNFKMTMVQAFELDYLYTSDTNTVEAVETWIMSLIKTGIIISRSGDLERKRFFDQQEIEIQRIEERIAD